MRSRPFTVEALREEVASAAGLDPLREPPAQVRYLGSYLSNDESGARTILIEAPYVDRHYLEEFAGYYASAFGPPSSRTVRLHFFRSDWGPTAVEVILNRVEELGLEAAERELTEDYLGFIVVRPLASAPIGRTILRPYADASRARCYEPATTLHDVHLLGLTLRVAGVPFQQQDQGVGACATTAVWSALARVTRADGARAVTPLAVTVAATKNLALGRAFPAAKGLERSQLLEAIRHVGYAPDVISADEPQLFQHVLKCYVRSGIPVILNVFRREWDDNHAVTVVGFREGADEEGVAEIDYRSEGISFGLRTRGLERVYVHDDRFGPYARMTWGHPEGGGSLPQLQFAPYELGYDEFKAPVTVQEAYAPLYPKLRMGATDLVLFASQVLPLVRQLAGGTARDRLNVDLRFVLSGRYRREAHRLPLAAERRNEVLSALNLPRYVGLIRFSIAGEWFLDVVCDTTDIPRESPVWSPVLAFVPADPDLRETLESISASSSRIAIV